MTTLAVYASGSMSTAPIDDQPGQSPGKGPFVVRPLRASAVRIKLGEGNVAKGQAARRQAWQAESWEYFDDVPEVKNLTWFLGNAMSKLKIFVAVRPDDDPNAVPIPATDPESGIPQGLALRAEAELRRLKGPLGGRSEIQRECNMNWEVAGECYLVMRGPQAVKAKNAQGQLFETGEFTAEAWDIKSTREVTVKGEGEYWIKDDPNDGTDGVKLNETTDAIIRMYQRHPGASALADCHMRGVLSECELVTLLTNELKAESKSRQSAGFLTLPNELSYGPMNTETVEGEDAEEAVADPFEDSLMTSIIEPIEDPASPHSVYPLVIRGPAEFLKPDVLRHFSIARDTTNLIEQRIEARVQRIARGLNAPVEATLGHQSTTFANAFQINEDTYEDYLQPRAVMLADALTIGFLVPNLLMANAGPPEMIERLIVWFSAEDIFKRADPVEDAEKALDVGAISFEAYRSYKGFTDDDAPDLIEQLFRWMTKVSRVDPNLVDAIINELDPTLNPPPPVGTDGSTPPGDKPAGEASAYARMVRLLVHGVPEKEVLSAARKQKASINHMGQKLAAIDRELRTKIQTATNAALNRALEKAGNKLKAKGVQANALLRDIHPMYAAAQLGPTLVAAAGFSDNELMSQDAWISLQQQYTAWTAQGAEQALSIVHARVGLSPQQLGEARAQSQANIAQSWEYMHTQLNVLATKKLYEPDPTVIPQGEFDPTMRVPAGLVRNTLAQAGGQVIDSYGVNEGEDAYVSLTSDGDPLAGIATGDLISTLLSSNDIYVDAYQWDYGPSYRKDPFEQHLQLDGEVFTDFDSDVLRSEDDWIGSFYFPGDHDGCMCDFVPTYALASELEESDVENLIEDEGTDAIHD